MFRGPEYNLTSDDVLYIRRYIERERERSCNRLHSDIIPTYLWLFIRIMFIAITFFLQEYTFQTVYIIRMQNALQ